MLLEPFGGPLRLPEFGKSLLILAVNQTMCALMWLLETIFIQPVGYQWATSETTSVSCTWRCCQPLVIKQHILVAKYSLREHMQKNKFMTRREEETNSVQPGLKLWLLLRPSFPRQATFWEPESFKAVEYSLWACVFFLQDCLWTLTCI